MQKDERDLLEVLKSELEFLEHHGYRRSPETAWRPKAIFEDSPSCINFHSAGNPRPCTDCALIYLVPPAHRSAKSPCRHIPLNESGETLDSLYRYGSQRESENAVGTWLRAAIPRLDPACSTAFHWTGGGKFFRFRPDPHSATSSSSER